MIYFKENINRILLTGKKEDSPFSGIENEKDLINSRQIHETWMHTVLTQNLDDNERKLTNLRDGSGQSRRSWIINEMLKFYRL